MNPTAEKTSAERRKKLSKQTAPRKSGKKISKCVVLQLKLIKTNSDLLIVFGLATKHLNVTDSQRYENTLSNKTHEWNPKINQNTSSECLAPTTQRKLQPSDVRPADYSTFPRAQSRLPHSSAERPFFRASRLLGVSLQLGGNVD
jgi:hypothetical protein